MWMSDSPQTASGFGNVTRHVCKGLAERGHEVLIVGWQADGMATQWEGCTVLPGGRGFLGADVLLQHLQRHRPELLITLADVWWLSFIADYSIARFLEIAQIPWVMYYPIDSDLGDGRLPPSWVRMLRAADYPVAMSRYGADISSTNGVRSDYIPHGVDARLFSPADNRQAAKHAWGYEGRFVVLSDARNQPRKMIPRTLDIFRRFAAARPDALLHLHCDPDDPAASTREYRYNLRADIEMLGLGELVRITAGMSVRRGLSLDALASIYRAADVHLLSSTGEGFGLPTLQAAAAGVVPMACDYTASRELTQGHGESVRVSSYLLDEFGLRRGLIDIEDAACKLARLHGDRNLLAHKQLASHRFAQSYDWRSVLDSWETFLKDTVKRGKRREIPATLGWTSWLPSLGGGQEDECPATSREKVFSKLPPGVRASIKVTAHRPGEHAADVVHDAARPDRTLTIPVTLPSSQPALAPARRPGLVYLASSADVEAFALLKRVFPGLEAWSQQPLPLEPDSSANLSLASSVSRPDPHQQLAASVLALDVAGTDPELPKRAAEAGVACVSCASNAGTRQLWPSLAIADAGPQAIALRVRGLLTDQADYDNVCRLAQECLQRRCLEECV